MPQAIRYKDYLDRIASAEMITKYPKGGLARKAMMQAVANGVIDLEEVKA